MDRGNRAWGVVVVVFTWGGAAHAGQVTAQGAVTALTDINQMGPMQIATFDDVNGSIPLGQYTALGMTFHTGPLTTILPGSTTPGNAAQGFTQPVVGYFPSLQGGGVADINCAFLSGVVTFTSDTTQFGMTISRNGTQYITVWDELGAMIGQVRWEPANDSTFIGVDTQGVPIGMLAFGNDDLWAGQAYDVGGTTNISDTWVWAAAPGCQNDVQCDDGDLCNGAEVCNAGLCEDGTPPVCDDGEACTDDSCDPDQGCVAAPNQDACDDGDMCTENSVCGGGTCGGGTPVDCSDGSACTVDMCDPGAGCFSEPIADCCTQDVDCPADMMCDLDVNMCVPIPAMSTGEMSTTDGETTGGETTGGETTNGTTTELTATTSGETSGASDTTGGETSSAPETTGGDEPTTSGTGGASNSGTGEEDTGATPTTSGGGSTSAGGPDGSSSSVTDGLDDGGGCGCRSDGPAPVGWGLLALLAWIRRRRSA